MKKEFIGLDKLPIVFLSIIFLSSGIFAVGESCFITERSTCEGGGGNVVMGLSAGTNAHGELASEGNYADVLCCNFAGSLTCDGTNKILGLSSNTNAHAEIPNETTYSTEVCYSDLNCISTTLDCGNTSSTLPVVSLSDSTNAHIGGIGNYSINICCSSASFVIVSSDVYWSEDGTSEISGIDVVTGTTTVKLVFKNSGLAEGTEVSFDIWEDDLFLDDFIKTINATIDSNGSAIAEWTIIFEDLEKTINDYEEFYFEVNKRGSDYLVLTILEISECNTIVLCGDYDNLDSCGNDNCQIAGTSAAPTDVNCDDPTRNCFCSWDDQCNFKFDLLDEGNGTIIGTCSFIESTTDDCSDGLLSYSWTATWSGASADKPAECSDGSRILECPAQIQLPFFGIYNIIVATLFIALIHSIIILRNKKE